jgi:hypothetical protein
VYNTSTVGMSSDATSMVKINFGSWSHKPVIVKNVLKAYLTQRNSMDGSNLVKSEVYLDEQVHLVTNVTIHQIQESEHLFCWQCFSIAYAIQLKITFQVEFPIENA